MANNKWTIETSHNRMEMMVMISGRFTESILRDLAHKDFTVML